MPARGRPARESVPGIARPGITRPGRPGPRLSMPGRAQLFSLSLDGIDGFCHLYPDRKETASNSKVTLRYRGYVNDEREWLERVIPGE